MVRSLYRGVCRSLRPPASGFPRFPPPTLSLHLRCARSHPKYNVSMGHDSIHPDIPA